MRTETIQIYEASDYEKYSNQMSVKDVISALNRIDSRWIARSNYFGQDDYEGTGLDFELFTLHTALRYTINTLKEIEKCEKPER